MLTVGVLARRFGLARSTLLYYDKLGLLRPSSRSLAGYRRYSEDDERRLEQICTNRRAGLSLAAIGRLLDGTPGALAPVLEGRMRELDEEIEGLRAQQRVVAELLQTPMVAERVAVVDVRTWTELLAASGMSELDMERWHAAFERSAPDKHQRFLELLGLDVEQIATIRRWSREGSQPADRAADSPPDGSGDT
jgi:DNA-binding transcriptional MerR regulator